MPRSPRSTSCGPLSASVDTASRAFLTSGRRTGVLVGLTALHRTAGGPARAHRGRTTALTCGNEDLDRRDAEFAGATALGTPTTMWTDRMVRSLGRGLGGTGLALLAAVAVACGGPRL